MSHLHAAVVESVDCAARTITLRPSGGPAGTYRIASGVDGWETLRKGDGVDATVRLQLTVYVPQSPGLDTSSLEHPPDARVLAAEPSYRMLTLQYAGGATETFKVSLSVPLTAVSRGSWVDIRPVEALAVHARRRLVADAGTCSASGVLAGP